MADKKYYWLKLNHDFFKRSDIKIVEGMENGKDYVLFYLKLMLESISHNGALRFNDTIPYNEKMLATITDTNLDIVRSAMQVFTSMGMIEVLDDDTIYMTEVEKMIGSAVDNDNANRQRRFREKKKALEIAGVTKSNAGVTESNENNNESKSIEIEKDIELETEKEIEIEKEVSKKESKGKATSFDAILDSVDFIREDAELRYTFVEFIKMRKVIKKPLTDFALKKIINEAYKLADGNPDTIKAILEQSIVHSWQGVFPLKEPYKKYTGNNDTNSNEFDELLKQEGFT